MGFFLLGFFLFPLITSLTIFIFKKRRPDHHNKLPPGSLGLPFLGETLQLFYQRPDTFFSSRQKRYGDIFKTQILGCPSIMVANPEAIKYVLVSEPNLFKPSSAPSKKRLIGEWAIFYHQGNYHSQLRKSVQACLSLDVIRGLMPDIESIVVSCLNSMASGHVIKTYQEMKKFTPKVASLTIFGHLEPSYQTSLMENYFILDEGYNSFPINLPGFSYSRSLNARRKLGIILDEIISKRKEMRIAEKGLLGKLLSFEGDNKRPLNDDQIADNIIGVLFAAQDTTASMLTWIIKYISDDPKLFDAIKEEQKEVYDLNECGKQPLTWAQTKKMPFTNKVISESLRMASIIAFTYREAVEDVVYDGYLIPKGWKVLPLFRSLHENPIFFLDPHTFDPSRFEGGLKPNTYMPFGTGVHTCPGNEVAKLEMLIFIHHLVNNFRWEVVGPEGVEYDPFPVPKNGLPTKFWKESQIPCN